MIALTREIVTGIIVQKAEETGTDRSFNARINLPKARAQADELSPGSVRVLMN